MHLPTLASTLLLSRAQDPLTNKPDYSKDKFPPYPSMTNADGSAITIENLRGTRLYGWKGCEVDESKAIAAAFDDFYKLANPLSSKIDWASETAEDFWGKNEGKNRVPDDRRKQIQQIFQAQQQMYAIGWHLLPPYWTSLWIEVRCSGGDETGDPDNICKDKKPNDGQCGRGGSPVGGNDNTLEAYSESPTTNKALTYSRMTFCNKFFNLPSLSDAMSNTPKKPALLQGKLDAWDNRARVFLHETTHLDYFMNAPGSSPLVDDLQFDWREQGVVVRDWAYGPFFCKILRNYGLQGEVAFYPQRNADSYAWFALGNYVKQVTKTYPRNPRPRNVPVDDPMNSGGGDVRAADADPALSAGQPPEDVVTESTEDAYQYAEGFSMPNCPDTGIKTNAGSSGAADPDLPSPPAADKNACHGVSGDYWVMSRDVAVENVKDFCGQMERAKKYNVGSVNELELSIKKLSGSTQGPKDSPDCIGRFTRAVIDGCDGNDPINNPHNYKFGSTLTTGDGWEYKMTPLAKQVNEVACDVSYKFFFDGFEVRGKNWPDAKLGANGEGLRKELEGCGALTNWNFERTPNDCCFQWYASGQLPIGTKSCVGSAVQSAGGSGNGNCHGAGKRGVRRDNIDRWPGYADSSRHVFENNSALV